MAAEVPTTEPDTLRAGDTLTWQKSLADYPATAGWVLRYALRNATSKISITAGASGADHLVSVLASVSAVYPPGRYDWSSYVTKTTEQYTIAQGSMQVLPNLAADALYDARTDARIIYDDLIVAYKAYVGGKQGHVSEYQVAGRSMRFKSTEEILDQMKYWHAIVVAEENADRRANGKSGGNIVKAIL